MQSLLTEFDVSNRFGIDVREVRKLVESGELPHIQFPSGDIRFILDEIWQWAKSKMKPGTLPEVQADAAS